MASGERILRSTVQRMKPEPASPDQRVPSQSKTATLGASDLTAAWNSAVVRTRAGTTATVGSAMDGVSGILAVYPSPILFVKILKTGALRSRVLRKIFGPKGLTSKVSGFNGLGFLVQRGELFCSLFKFTGLHQTRVPMRIL